MELNYEYISSNSDFDRVVSWCSERRSLCLDTETSGLNPFSEKIILLQIGNEDKQWIVDTRVVDIRKLFPIFFSEDILKLGQNIKHDLMFFLREYNAPFRAVKDTMIAEQIIRMGLHMGVGMDDLMLRYFGKTIDKDIDLRMSFAATPVGEFSKRQLDYAAGDVVHPIHIIRAQKEQLKKRGSYASFFLECEFIPVLAEMELAGMLLDVDAWKLVYQNAIAKLAQAEKRLDSILDTKISKQDTLFGDQDITKSINYNSNQQIKKILESRGYIVASTGSKYLALQGILGLIPTPLVQAIIDYRVYSTAKSRYGLNFLEAIEPSTGRIHSSFSQCFTDTHRLNSGATTLEGSIGKIKRVNFQNIPADKDYREAFRAKPGYKYIIHDYQAIEPRILGDMSQDPTYLNAFNNDKDIYGEIGNKIYGEEVSKRSGKAKELRDKTKITILGNSYGTGKDKFYKKLLVDFNMIDGVLREPIKFIEQEESDNLYDKFFEICPKIKECLDEMSALADPSKSDRRVYDDITATEDYKTVWAKSYTSLQYKNLSETIKKDIATKLTNRRGYLTYAESYGGRKRYFKVYHPSTYTEGRNSPIQIGAAIILKTGMIDVFKAIKEHGHDATIINQVHDEIIIEVREDQAEEVNVYVKHILEEAGMKYFKHVPCKVEGGISDKWEKN